MKVMGWSRPELDAADPDDIEAFGRALDSNPEWFGFSKR